MSRVEKRMTRRVFFSIYVFFVLNTIVTPVAIKNFIVLPHKNFCLQFTAHLYQALNATMGAAHASQSVSSGFQADSLTSYLWIVLHNAVLPLIAAAFFAVSILIPRVYIPWVQPVLEYLRTLAVLFFFAFGLVVLVMNAALIPFVIATVSVAMPAQIFDISASLLVHGIIEYAALSLVITVPIVAFQRLKAKRRAEGGPNLRSLIRDYGVIKGYFWFWYRSVLSQESLGQVFVSCTKGFRGYAVKLYGLSILAFSVAAVLETYVSPAVQAALIHTA